MDENKSSSISKASTDEEIGKFWNAHDFTDFDDPNLADVDFEFSCAVPIEADLFSALEGQARKHGVRVETLVNLWLQQKLLEQANS